MEGVEPPIAVQLWNDSAHLMDVKCKLKCCGLYFYINYNLKC